MRRRFFVDEVRNGHAQIEGDDARHLTRVLRVEVGQRYEISDNRNVYLAEIETARKESVVFRTLERLELPAPGPRLILCAALIKFDHFEWMIEKATELGVSEIVPVETTRGEHGLERAARKRIERWRRIALEASQQSRRAFLPEIAEPVRLGDALETEAAHRVVFDEEASEPVSVPAGFDSLALLIGPEGGWTDEERAQFTGWTRASLGPLILRAETAALAALAIAGSQWSAR
ncbi:MAG: 16S rRNA (uracil(1498)-N(3))-methyltransferase [Acidobacteriia bacterium]|nr:16S rRNA (uracil(1498)-N(3))-methyltransferase [Terriglobia bacterium]